MKITRTHFMPKRFSSIDFEDFSDQINQDLQRKADALQARRWRKLNREMRISPYLDSHVKRGGGIL
jgi:hypothetical protein